MPNKMLVDEHYLQMKLLEAAFSRVLCSYINGCRLSHPSLWAHGPLWTRISCLPSLPQVTLTALESHREKKGCNVWQLIQAYAESFAWTYALESLEWERQFLLYLRTRFSRQSSETLFKEISSMLNIMTYTTAADSVFQLYKTKA